MDNKILYDVTIIGGGPAAVSSAIYTVRKGLKVLLIADSIGGQVITTNDIENIIGTPKTTGYEFTQSLEKHLSNYEVDKYIGHKVSKVELDGNIKKVITDDLEFRTKTVIIATGAKHKKLNQKGEDEFSGKGVHYCATCDGPFYRNLNVLVVGGGNSGVEAAIDLSNIAKSVTLMEYMPTLKADIVLQEQLNKIENIKVITNAAVDEIKGEQFVKEINYIDRATNEMRSVEIDGIFIEIGITPNTEVFKDLLEMNKLGEIKVDGICKTNIEGIFAAGDCTDVAYKQIIIALGDGAKAGLSAFNYVLNFEK